ncbi:hypothetical protein HDU96_001472 [Phlyctochytrium bullatum]|nr:hypothetical protein HDU96_001472 [Phlyctochytrium bullatum]
MQPPRPRPLHLTDLAPEILCLIVGSVRSSLPHAHTGVLDGDGSKGYDSRLRGDVAVVAKELRQPAVAVCRLVQTCKRMNEVVRDEQGVWKVILEQVFDAVPEADLKQADPKAILIERLTILDLPRRLGVPKNMGSEGDPDVKAICNYVNVLHSMVLQHESKNLFHIASMKETAEFLQTVRLKFEEGELLAWTHVDKLMQVLSHLQATGKYDDMLLNGFVNEEFWETECLSISEYEHRQDLWTLGTTYRARTLCHFMMKDQNLYEGFPPVLVRPLSTLIPSAASRHLPGPWHGFYFYHGMHRNTEGIMDFSLQFADTADPAEVAKTTQTLIHASPVQLDKGKVFMGTGVDGVARFRIDGWLDEETGEVWMLKAYEPSFAWTYRGFLNEFGMLGSFCEAEMSMAIQLVDLAPEVLVHIALCSIPAVELPTFSDTPLESCCAARTSRALWSALHPIIRLSETCRLFHKLLADNPTVWKTLFHAVFDPVQPTRKHKTPTDFKALLRKRRSQLGLRSLQPDANPADQVRNGKMNPLCSELYLVHCLVRENVSRNLHHVYRPDLAESLMKLRCELGHDFKHWPFGTRLLQILAHLQAAGLDSILTSKPSTEFFIYEIKHWSSFEPVTLDFVYRIQLLCHWLMSKQELHDALPPLLYRPVPRAGLNGLNVPIPQLLSGTWHGFYFYLTIMQRTEGMMEFELECASEPEDTGSSADNDSDADEVEANHDEDSDASSTVSIESKTHHPPQHYRLRGKGEDPVDEFTLDGHVDVTSSKFEMRKEYQGDVDDALSWDYKGMVTEFGLAGTWRDGYFFCWKVADAKLEKDQNEAEVTD